MSDRQALMDALDARVARREGRRAFFTQALAAGAGAFAVASAAQAQAALTDNDVLNFALNLEYLEANFYAFAVTGSPIAASVTTGTGTAVAATGGRKVSFTDSLVAAYAAEIAADELAHVNALRSALGSAAVAQPAIDLGVTPTSAFSRAAQAAGIVPAGTAFDAYASDENFLLAAFIFEDVGVTAYKGAAGLLSSKVFLEAAAGILAVEAYHAATVRTTLYRKGIDPTSGAVIPGNTGIQRTEQISQARDSLDGASDLDQGVAPITRATGVESNIAPLDANGLAFSRTTEQVLNIVYLTNAQVTAGGFFPSGVNGTIKSSGAN